MKNKGKHSNNSGYLYGGPEIMSHGLFLSRFFFLQISIPDSRIIDMA